MSPKRICVVVAVLVFISWALVVMTVYAFRILLCAETEYERRTSPDGRTIAIERDDACLTKHATVVVLERAGLPSTTLVWESVVRVQGAELEWHGDHELWVTLVASAAEAAAEAEGAPRRFDDVTVRYFTVEGEELRARR
jgi:hypothetical protein